jgi:predicted transcriptional regulator
LISPLFFSGVFAHQSDSVGDYRIEIDWKNKPIVTGESNAIIVYVSEMDNSKEASDQPFDPAKGIEGLRKTLKIQLVVDTESITMPLQTTDVPGKYESPITPTFSGWSQLNFIGKINEQNVNLALHPLKVEEQEVLQFPSVESTVVESGDFEREIDDLRGDIRELQETINELKEQPSDDSSTISYVAIVLGVIGIAIGAASFAKKK